MTASESHRPEHDAPTGKLLDSKKIEVLARSVFHAIFGKGIRVPLKLNGLMDVDLVVRDTNVIVNLNKIEMQAPELLIWRFVFAYQGKPVMEYGRGIKNDLKIHFPNLLFLFLTLWRERRRKLRARAKAESTLGHEMVALATPDPTGTIPTTTG